MYKKINLIFVLTLSVALSACTNEGNEGEETADNSSQAEIVENAVFTDLDGNDVDIKDFAGKIILIDFWESWCGPCLQVFPAMDDLREEYPDDFAVLAVTVGLSEGPNEAKKFAEENGYDFNWLYDEYRVFEKLGGQGIPFKVYVDPDGKLIEIEMGSRGSEGDYDAAKAKIQEYF